MATVLVVEDSMTEMEVLTSCLRKAGWVILSAFSAEEALQIIQRQPPNCLVLDVVLPGMSGFELCRTLKNEPGTQQIPIVLCSTKSTDMDKFWGMRQGADAYLTKPVDQGQLVETVRNLMRWA